MESIAKMGITDITHRLAEGQNMSLDVSSCALESLSERGYNVRYGARPLKRVLNQELLHPLSRMILEGGVREDEIVRIRTRAEAESLSKKENKQFFGFVTSSKNHANDLNDIVVLRNHPVDSNEDEKSSEENSSSDKDLLEA